MSGYLKNFKEQIDTLSDVYYELIEPIEKQATLKNWWLFGGGTALSIFHFNHRKSFDIDIFITESQVFDFFNPKWFIDDTKIFDTENYKFDGFTNHLMLKTKNNIKVDFLLNESIINTPIKNNILDLGFDLYYESIEDIIAKKVKWRKEDNLARDIFDLAVALVKDKHILQNILNSRFITMEDLKKLDNALNDLNIKQYKLEIEKIQPQTNGYMEIALNGKYIIQSAIKEIILLYNNNVIKD